MPEEITENKTPEIPKVPEVQKPEVQEIATIDGRNELEDIKKEIAQAKILTEQNENLTKGMKPFVDLLEKFEKRFSDLEGSVKSSQNETALNKIVSGYAKELNMSVEDFKARTQFNSKTSNKESLKIAFESMKSFYLKNANAKTGTIDPENEAKEYKKIFEEIRAK